MGKRLAGLCITAVYTVHNYIKLLKILKFNLSIDYVKVEKTTTNKQNPKTYSQNSMTGERMPSASMQLLLSAG